MTPDEARAALGEIELTAAKIRRVIAQGHFAPLLILWGCIWVVGFSNTQFFPASAGQGWLALDLGGFLGSWFLVARQKSPMKKKGDPRIFLFWVALMIYAVIWMLLLLSFPDTGQPSAEFIASFNRRVCAYWATVPMFAYVTAGLFLDRFLAWLGIAVTVLTLAGLYLAGSYFALWVAVTGGGALILSGLFIRKFWR
jgi:hypothetical protein